MSYTQEELDKIVEWKSLGLSSRKICDKLGWDRTRKSTVNQVYNRWLEVTSVKIHPLRHIDNSKPLEVKERKSLNLVPQAILGIDGYKPNGVNILYWDLETSPEEAFVWGRWKINVADCQVKRYSHILTCSYAFNDGKPVGVKLTPEDVQNEDDLTAVVDMALAINHADVIVTFNGKKFDLKYLKTRILKWGLPPLKPVKHIDLFEQAKRHFRFPSNSMDNICKYLGYSTLKIKTDFDLWKRCLSTNDNISSIALEEMNIYCKGDIEVTRNLHKQMSGWVTGTNIGTIVNHKQPENSTLRCKCGSDDIQPEQGFHYTSMNGFQLYRCGSCRGVTRINIKGDKLVEVV